MTRTCSEDERSWLLRPLLCLTRNLVCCLPIPDSFLTELSHEDVRDELLVLVVALLILAVDALIETLKHDGK